MLKILQQIASDEVLNQYSWQGTPEKSIYKDLNLNSVMLQIIQDKFEHYTLHDFEKCSKNWIRHACERINRNEKKNP